MKKIIFLVVFAAASYFTVAQESKKAATHQFTKSELLAFADFKALLSAVTGKDYSVALVRNFHLSITVKDSNGAEVKLSEMGPGGTWSKEQKELIEKHAVKGAVFTVEKIVMFEGSTKNMLDQPAFSITIKD